MGSSGAINNEALTDGTLLDGRVRYVQPRQGYRTGIEPVLLAASIPAQPGDLVLEAGAGAGAASLCLLSRVAARGVAVERDPFLAALSGMNLRRQGQGGVALAADVTALPFRQPPLFHHAMANPPWHDAAGPASANPRRDAAKRARPDTLPQWTRALAACVRHRGTLSLIVPASQTDQGLAALQQAGCGSLWIFPLWPRTGQNARLVILRGSKGGRGPTLLQAGLTLHEPDGRFTPDADRVLRGGMALALAGAGAER